MFEFLAHAVGLCPDAHAHIDLMDLAFGGVMVASAAWCWTCAVTGKLCKACRRKFQGK